MNLNKSMEMYLETIYILATNHGHAHVAEIAERLSITKPSVTKAMDKLKKEGFINKESYGHITLTEKGETAAKGTYYKHCIIARFLEKSLGLTPSEASLNACRMEHIITDVMLAEIESYLDNEKATVDLT